MKTNNQFKNSILQRIMVLSIFLLFSMPLIMNGQNWKTNGNAAVAADFLGTNNAQDLRIRTNGTQKLVVTTTGNVGIGTTTPAAKLDVIGKIKITDGSQGAGKVLVSDANGLATWQIISTPPSGWGLTGNAGTVDGTNFIGTTDDVALNFRVNNQRSGRIDRVQFNTFFGYQSGESNTIGVYNTANGMAALASNTEGTYATAIGSYALYANTSGINNTACGSFALSSNTIGLRNTATGYAALMYNTSGFYNTANGANSLNSNTTGSYNTANGYQALNLNSTGEYNTANGAFSLPFNTTGYYNTAVGGNALYSNTEGYVNTATGMQSLRNNYSGSYNTASGQNSLYENTTGSFNTASGVVALGSNTTGIRNTAFGLGALGTNTSGNDNTAIGYGADVSAADLTNATAIGANAVVSTSNSMVLGNNVNVGIGLSNPTYKLSVTGSTERTGSFINSSTFYNASGVFGRCDSVGGNGIGVTAGGGWKGVSAFSTRAGGGNRYGVHSVAGYGDVVNMGGYFESVGGGSSSYGVYATAAGGTVNWTGFFNGDVYCSQIFTASDRKLKKDIRPLDNAMSIINKLNPSVYNFRNDDYKQLNLPEGLQYGLIADEVQQVLPGAVKKAIQPAKYENNDEMNGS